MHECFDLAINYVKADHKLFTPSLLLTACSKYLALNRGNSIWIIMKIVQHLYASRCVKSLIDFVPLNDCSRPIFFPILIDYTTNDYV